SRYAADSEPMTEPPGMPAHIAVESDARSRFGAYSHPKASAFGIAPPKPIPARKRHTASCSTLVIYAVKNVNTPKINAEIHNVRLRPQRSALIPKNIAPTSGPIRPAPTAIPRAPLEAFRASLIFGSATPMIVRSKPSSTTARKQRTQTHAWYG